MRKRKSTHLGNVCSMLVIGFLISSCMSSRVYTNVDETVDFREYNTYAWLPEDDSIDYVSYDRERICEAIVGQINEELQDRGIQLDRQGPDMLVSVHTMFEEQTRTVRQPIYPSYGYYPGWYIAPWYGPYYFYGFTSVHPYGGDYIESVPYMEGTIVVDLVDRESNKIIWRGWIRKEIDPVEFLWDVKKYVHDIFKKYPIDIAAL